MRAPALFSLALVACAPGSSTSPDSALPPTNAVRFDDCAAHELPKHGGGCAAVGVDRCGEGFSADGTGGCQPILPAAPCGEGMIALPGDVACRPIGDCGSDRYGSPPTTASAPTLYVDGAHVGDSDGSRDKPFRTITEATDALSSRDTVIAIAAGAYAEDVYVRFGARIWGRCASMVTIKGVSATTAAVELGGDSSLRGVTVTGPGWGVLIDDGVVATVEQSVIRDVARVAVEAASEGRPTRATLRDVLIDGATEEGVFADGAEVSLERSIVRNIKPYKSKSGIGVRAEIGTISKKPASVVLRRSIVERATEAGVAALASSVTIESSIVRDTSPRPDGALGVGIYAENPSASAFVSGSLITRNRRANVYLVGAVATIERSVLSEGRPAPGLALFGLGLEARLGSEVTIAHTLIASNMTSGVMFRGARGTITSSIVRDTRANEGNGQEGFGIAVWLDAPSLTKSTAELRTVLVVRNHSAGVAIGGSTATLEDIAIRETSAATDGAFGDGLIVGSANTAAGGVLAGEATVSRALVERNARGGAVVAAASLRIADAALRCNALDLEVSSEIAARGTLAPIERQFALTSEGNVECGCGATTPCRAHTSTFRSIAGPSDNN